MSNCIYRIKEDLVEEKKHISHEKNSWMPFFLMDLNTATFFDWDTKRRKHQCIDVRSRKWTEFTENLFVFITQAASIS
jgi:hypothetical protein